MKKPDAAEPLWVQEDFLQFRLDPLGARVHLLSNLPTRLRRLGEELAAGGGSAVREQLDRFMEDND